MLSSNIYMGPTILFDKSFLQSLSVDESVWFDHFFTANICPIFFIETLSDLDKSTKTRSPEDEVRIIAEKTPLKDGHPNIFHSALCLSELLGGEVVMDGRPLVRQGKLVQIGKKNASVSELPAEMEAFLRWQDGEFEIVEKKFAKTWRDSIKSVDLDTISKSISSIGTKLERCKSFEEVKNVTDSIVDGRDDVVNRLKLIFTILAIPPRYFQEVYIRWVSRNTPPLSIFAPYAAHALTLEIFFYIAAYSNLISPTRASNKIDLSYLFYSPFCHVFVSSDKLHRKCAPLFLRKNQKFIWGQDLKADLTKIDEYYDKFADDLKDKGIFELAPYPPLDNSFLTRRIWNSLLAGKTKREPERKSNNNDKTTEEMVAYINRLVDTAKFSAEDQVLEPPTEFDEIVITRKIRKKKGKWWQVPKNLKE